MNVIDIGRGFIKERSLDCALEISPKDKKEHLRFKTVLANPEMRLVGGYPTYLVFMHRIKEQYLATASPLEKCWIYAHYPNNFDKRVNFVKGLENSHAFSQTFASLDDKTKRRLAYISYFFHLYSSLDRTAPSNKRGLLQSKIGTNIAATMRQKHVSQLPVQKVLEKVVTDCSLSKPSIPPITPTVAAILQITPPSSLKDISKVEGDNKQKVDEGVNKKTDKTPPKSAFRAFIAYFFSSNKFKKVCPEVNADLHPPIEREAIGKSKAAAPKSSRGITEVSSLDPVVHEIVLENLLKAEEKALKYQILIESLQQLITSNPNLQQVCVHHMILDQENILRPSAKIPKSLYTNNPIDVMTRKTLEANNLQGTFEEVVTFINRNKEVAAAFKESLATNSNGTAFKDLQRLSQSPDSRVTVQGHCKIEEI